MYQEKTDGQYGCVSGKPVYIPTEAEIDFGEDPLGIDEPKLERHNLEKRVQTLVAEMQR